MSDQDKIDAIVAAIQTDANLLILLRAAAIVSLVSLSSDHLDNIMTELGLS